MYDRLANWTRSHQRLLMLLAILVAILLNFPKVNQAMEGMINGLFDGFHGQPYDSDAGR
jgi:hypothetical protein